jgi:hypothetical protein
MKERIPKRSIAIPFTVKVIHIVSVVAIGKAPDLVGGRILTTSNINARQ